MLESAFSIVAVIFVMMGVGYVAQWKGWLGANAATVLSRLTLRVGMPGLIFSNIMMNYTREMLFSSAYSLLAPIAVLAAMYLLSAPAAGLMKIPEGRRGVFRALFTFGNTMFVGLPVCRAILGEDAVPVVMLYYLVNTTLWWMIGAPAVARDAGGEARTQKIGIVRRAATPPLVTCFFSIALVLIGVKPPAIVMTVADSLGKMVTPLSMLFIGVTLYSMVSGGLRWQKGYGAVIAARALIGPAICMAACLLLGLPKLTTGTFFLEAGMPAQTQSCLWAQEHGADAGYAAGGVALTTLAGLLAIPVYAWILGWM